MVHTDYIGGVTLIPAKEKSDEVVGYDDDGLPQLRERQDLMFVPYMKVETRVVYFWKLVALNAERNWVGAIEDVITPGAAELGLPPSFFKFSAADPKGKTVAFVGCSKRVRIYERSRTTGELTAVMSPPPGTKAVPVSTKWDIDQNAIHKAETGAIGRALGFAGMLVLPGSGVATAEDMQEDQAVAGAGELGPTPPALPAEPPTAVALPDDELRDRARELLGRLEPQKASEFQDWASSRRFEITTAAGPVLRGAVRKLEKLLDGS